MSLFLDELNDLQTTIMLFVKDWVNVKKTPVPQKEIINYMVRQKIKDYTVLFAIRTLRKKGYIRDGYSEKANRVVYVMTRNI